MLVYRLQLNYQNILKYMDDANNERIDQLKKE